MWIAQWPISYDTHRIEGGIKLKSSAQKDTSTKLYVMMYTKQAIHQFIGSMEMQTSQLEIRNV
jgi:hypothetical protein